MKPGAEKQHQENCKEHNDFQNRSYSDPM